MSVVEAIDYRRRLLGTHPEFSLKHFLAAALYRLHSTPDSMMRFIETLPLGEHLTVSTNWRDLRQWVSDFSAVMMDKVVHEITPGSFNIPSRSITADGNLTPLPAAASITMSHESFTSHVVYDERRALIEKKVRQLDPQHQAFIIRVVTAIGIPASRRDLWLAELIEHLIVQNRQRATLKEFVSALSMISNPYWR